MNDRPSMKDVAQRAGVSTKTVSNVVRGWPHVSPETRSKVQEALEDLGYRMNLSARTLRSGRSGILALALPWLNSPYFAELTSTVVRVAEEHSWTVLVDQTGGVLEHELAVVAGIRGQLIDGLIFSPHALGAAELGQLSPPCPMVLLGEKVGPGVHDHVAIDNVAAARDVVVHLASLGRTRIAAIGLPPQNGVENAPASLRHRGYELGLAAAGKVPDPSLQMSVDVFDRVQGARAMDRLLDLADAPDAVFCFSDLLALGAMHAIHQRGHRIPQDVAVAGFDDIEDGRFSYPTLTTISPDKEQIARIAVERLLSHINSGDTPLRPQSFTPPYRLIVRDSTTG